jgi:hypothetical protein
MQAWSNRWIGETDITNKERRKNNSITERVPQVLHGTQDAEDVVVVDLVVVQVQLFKGVEAVPVL